MNLTEKIHHYDTNKKLVDDIYKEHRSVHQALDDFYDIDSGDVPGSSAGTIFATWYHDTKPANKQKIGMTPTNILNIIEPFYEGDESINYEYEAIRKQGMGNSNFNLQRGCLDASLGMTGLITSIGGLLINTHLSEIADPSTAVYAVSGVGAAIIATSLVTHRQAKKRFKEDLTNPQFLAYEKMHEAARETDRFIEEKYQVVKQYQNT